jgi:hypothetical protein
MITQPELASTLEVVIPFSLPFIASDQLETAEEGKGKWK